MGAPLQRISDLAEALLADPPAPTDAPPDNQLWPLVNARASLLSRGAQAHADAPGPAGLNLMAAMNPRELGQPRFSNSVLRALLYSHGLVLEDPLVMAAELFTGSPQHTRAMARRFIESAAASIVQIDELIDAGIVQTFFTADPERSTLESEMSTALANSPVQTDELWDAFEAGYIDGLSPSLRELWRRIRAGDRSPPLELVHGALTETDVELVKTFVDVVSQIRPASVIDNTVGVVASAIDDVRRLGGRYDLLCASPLFARLLFLGTDDPVAALRVHQLANTTVPSIDSLEARDVVRMRQTGDAFELWRTHLSQGLDHAHRLRDELGPGVDVPAAVAEVLADARARLDSEAKASSVFGRDGWLAFSAGALGAAASAAVVKGPAAAALAAAGGAASTLVQRVLARATRDGHVRRHYVVFDRAPTAMVHQPDRHLSGD